MKKNFYLIFCICFSMTIVHAQDISRTAYSTNSYIKPIEIKNQWTDTGVKLSPGDFVMIRMEGIANTAINAYSSNGQNTYWIGPEGDGSELSNAAPLPSSASNGIIGKIGTSNKLFYVGRTISFTSNVTGNLFLGLNDGIFSDNYGYYLAFITKAPKISTSIISDEQVLPSDISVSQNYPNPFNPTTTIEYSVPKYSGIEIRVFDVQGSLVKTLVSTNLEAGTYKTFWDSKNEVGSKVASGTYFYQVKIDDQLVTKKMLLIK